MSQDGDPKASTTLLVGLTGAVLLLSTVIFTIAIFYNVERIQTVSKVLDRPYAEYDALRSQQQAELNAYRWVDQKGGVVAIPIERAMAVVLPDLKSPPPPTTIGVNGPSTASSRPAEEHP